MIEIGYGCIRYTKITELFIPKSVSKIDSYGFGSNTLLKRVTFEEGSQLEEIKTYTFINSQITDFEVPQNVYIMYGSAFHYNTVMKSISVHILNPYMISDERGLYSYNKTILWYCCSGYTDVYTIKSETTTLEIGAFVHYQGPGVNLPSNLQIIKYLCFAYSKITEITMPDTVKSLEGSVFLNCKQLTHATLSENISTIYSYTFQYSGIQSMHIPNKAKNIYKGAFSSCLSLEDFWLSSPLPKFDGGVFSLSPNIKFKSDDGTTLNINEENVVFNKDNTSVVGYFGSTEDIIHLPNTVKKIETRVFIEKDNIKKVVCDNGCQLESIGEYAFQNCINLQVFPTFSFVNQIGSYAFNGCALKVDLDFSSPLTLIDDFAFVNNQYLSKVSFASSSLLRIGKSAFRNCPNLQNLTFGGTAEINLSESCFQYSSNLEKLTITNKVHLASLCFSSCGLKNITFENNYVSDKTISTFCFKGCTNLSEIILPINCETIELEAFAGTSLTHVIIPNNILVLSRQCFRDCVYLKNITISDDSRLTKIEYAVFQGCSSFSYVNSFNAQNFCSDNGAIYTNTRNRIIVYPPANKNKFFAFSDQVKEIEQSSFIGCTNLEVILIPDNSVVSIGESAFKDCINLKQINIPKSVQSIGADAFSGCDNIRCGIIFENKTAEFKEMLKNSGLPAIALSICSGVTCKAQITRTFNYSLLFVFILM